MIDTVQLGEVLNLRKGKKAIDLRKRMIDGSKPYIQVNEVMGASPQKFTCDPNGVEVVPNDLCIVWHGANAGTVGYGVEGLIDSSVIRMRLKSPSSWDTRFIGRLLQSKFQQINEQAQVHNTTIPYIDKSRLEAIALPSISKKEQMRIVDILDRANDIRRNREKVLAMADNLLKAAYVHTIGRFNSSHGEWETYTIEQLSEDRKGAIRFGFLGDVLHHGEFVEEGVAVIGINNVVKNRFVWDDRRFIDPEKYEELQRYEAYPHDVIITTGDNIGQSAVIPEDFPKAIMAKHLVAITCNREIVHPEVLSFAIHSDSLIIHQIRNLNKDAAVGRLNLSAISKLKINCPPMEEQFRFVSVLRKTRAIQEKILPTIDDGSSLLQALVQRTFRGDL